MNNKKEDTEEKGFDINKQLQSAATAFAQEKGEKVEHIPLDKIRRNRFQPRIYFDPDEMKSLTAQVMDKGVIQPIIVRPANESDWDEDFEIADGERRWKAAKSAGLKTIPALIRNLSDLEMKETAFIGNNDRAPLTVFENIRYISMMFEELKDATEVARRFSHEKSTVEKYVRIYSRITCTTEFEKLFLKHHNVIDLRTATDFSIIAEKIAACKVVCDLRKKGSQKIEKKDAVTLNAVKKDNRLYERIISNLDKGKIKDALPKLLKKFGNKKAKAEKPTGVVVVSADKTYFTETDDTLIISITINKKESISQELMKSTDEAIDAFTTRVGELYANAGRGA